VGVLLDKVGLGNKVVQVFLFDQGCLQMQTMGMLFRGQFAMS
jgi:hypothetical protein